MYFAWPLHLLRHVTSLDLFLYLHSLIHYYCTIFIVYINLDSLHDYHGDIWNKNRTVISYMSTIVIYILVAWQRERRLPSSWYEYEKCRLTGKRPSAVEKFCSLAAGAPRLVYVAEALGKSKYSYFCIVYCVLLTLFRIKVYISLWYKNEKNLDIAPFQMVGT